MPAALPDFLYRLTDRPGVRRAAWLGFVSWVVALTTTGYLFGFSDGFFGRLLSATLVLWLLAAGTVFGIGPLLGWLTRRLGNGANHPARRGRAVGPKRPAGRSASSSAVPASKWR